MLLAHLLALLYIVSGRGVGEKKKTQQQKKQKQQKTTEETEGSASWRRTNVTTDEAKDSTNTACALLLHQLKWKAGRWRFFFFFIFIPLFLTRPNWRENETKTNKAALQTRIHPHQFDHSWLSAEMGSSYQERKVARGGASARSSLGISK